MESDLREYLVAWFNLVTSESFINENLGQLYNLKELGYFTDVRSAMVGALVGMTVTRWIDLHVEWGFEKNAERTEEFNVMFQEYLETFLTTFERTCVPK